MESSPFLTSIQAYMYQRRYAKRTQCWGSKTFMQPNERWQGLKSWLGLKKAR